MIESFLMDRLHRVMGGIRHSWTGSSETRKNRITAAVCFSLFLLLYGFTSHAEARASDEIAAFRTGVVLATNRSLAIDDIKSVQKITYIGTWGRGDHLYSRYFPGTALTTAFIYGLAARPGDTPYFTPNPTYGNIQLADSEFGARAALRVNAALGAMGMTMLFLLLASMFGRKTAVMTTVMMGLGTDWWYESQLFYLEIGAGALLMASFYFAYKEKPYLSSLSLAASLLFRPTNIIGLPVWGLAVWNKKPKELASGVFILGGLVFLALYNYMRFRSFFDFGYGGVGFSTPVLTGLLGLFLSPGHSFLIYSPITILAFGGAYLLWRRNKPVALVCALSIAGYILMAATWQSWSGGKVWGSRLIIPVIPILGVLVGAVLARLYANPYGRSIALVAVLALVGIGIQLLGIMQDPAIAIRQYTQNGYATVADTTWSVTRNWLVLEIMSLRHWTVCNTGAYSLRVLFLQCRQAATPW